KKTMDSGYQASNDSMFEGSVDTTSQELTDTMLGASIDTSGLTNTNLRKSILFGQNNLINEKVILDDPKGQENNAVGQLINEHGAAIPDKINIISNDEKCKIYFKNS